MDEVQIQVDERKHVKGNEIFETYCKVQPKSLLPLADRAIACDWITRAE